MFVGVYRAIYDYTAQAHGELTITEGDLLFILEKSTDDDWWKAKKKAIGNDEEEPEGLIPSNYIEEAPAKAYARALYEYQRQTDEELSFTEDARLEVFDNTDPDWTLVGLDGEYGFVPANYIEGGADTDEAAPPLPTRSRSSTADHAAQAYPSPAASPVDNTPAAALASIIQQKTGPTSPGTSRSAAYPPAAQYTPEASDEEAPPPMPQRPQSQQMSPTTPAIMTPRSPEPEARGVMPSSSMGQGMGYHLYNIHEMISHMGKNKKMPTTLGLNATKGTIMIMPERSKDGPQQEWTAEKLTHYSLEGKHVFMELVRPSKSIDFHAGAKDTAQEICSMLGELAGAARAEGLRDVIAATASTGQKKGRMLYDFMAQGDDEVTVAVEDDVIVLDDAQSEEWWMVRRTKNGKEGVVPASYVEITGVVAAEPPLSPMPPTPGTAPLSSTAAPNPVTSSTNRAERREAARREEERMAREAMKNAPRNQDVGPDLPLPDRHSSLGQRDTDARRSSQSTKRSRRQSQSNSQTSGKPDLSRVRTWTDRSGTFKVEAQFLGMKDNKINLHKNNGVKIAVEVGKMSLEDIEYVERETGRSFDEDKPLSEIRRRNTQRRNERLSRSETRAAPAASEPHASKKPEYDWFDFFLSCGVNPQICERYASAFSKDQMGEENMADINPTLLRTLGLKEGDILRVMKTLDAKFNRVGAATSGPTEEGGLFSGPGGALRNNTRKGRPAPTVQNTDTVDPRAFEQDGLKTDQRPDPTPTSMPPAPRRTISGFDDDAWDNRPPTEAAPARVMPPPAQPPAQVPALMGAMSDLSLLDAPLQPTKIAPQPLLQAPPMQQSQPTGADPSFFDKLAQPQARQRPQAPQQQSQSSLLPPPPQRPTSAPNNNQNSAFAPPPLRPQMTGGGTQLAPPGQSLAELNQQRNLQQMYPQQTGFMYPQQTGYQQAAPMGYQQTGFGNQQQLMNGQMTSSPFADPPRQQFQPQPTGFQPMQPQQTGVNNFLPLALQPQRTGFNLSPVNGYQQQQQQQPPQFGQQTNGFQANGFQPNGFQQQQTTGYQTNGFQQSNGLQTQQTGFNPSFGSNGLQPQMTGFGQQPQQFQAPPIPPIPQTQTPAPLQPQKTGPAPPIKFGIQAANKLTPQPTGRRANLAAATPQNPFGF